MLQQNFDILSSEQEEITSNPINQKKKNSNKISQQHVQNPENIDFEQTKEKIENLQSENKNINVTTIIKTESKHVLKEEFVISFTSNLRKMLEQYNVSLVEMKIILYIVEKMEFGNLFSINQTSLAKTLKTSQSAISRSFKSLKQKHIIIEDDLKNLYINSNIFIKGNITKLDDERRENLKKACKDKGFFNKSF